MTSTIRAPKAKGPQTGVMFIRGMRLYVETAGKVPGEKTVREVNNRVKARQ